MNLVLKELCNNLIVAVKKDGTAYREQMIVKNVLLTVKLVIGISPVLHAYYLS